MTYEERMQLTVEATRDTYKEIDAAIEAIFNQGRYIERHSNLLKAINGMSVHNDDGMIIDLHLGLMRNQMQQMKTALNDLISQYERQVKRNQEAEEAARANMVARG